MFKQFRQLIPRKIISPQLFLFFKIKLIVTCDFVLKTAGDFESQPTFPGTGCLFYGLEGTSWAAQLDIKSDTI